MGVSVSKVPMSEEEKQRNKQVERILAQEQRKSEGIFKLLLLGAGDSGKSTIIKQLKILHAQGFSEEEIRQQCILVSGNIVHAITTIIRAMTELDIRFSNPEREIDAKHVLDLYKTWTDKNSKLNFSDWCCLQRLWADEGLQACFDRSNEYQLAESTKYFCDDLQRISAPGYLPTEQDILHTRASTVGIVESTFTLRGLTLNVIDVGGQRSQRKKWIHCFDSVNAIIYVASLSEYDQVLFEDNRVNRMHESIKLFSTIINSPWFSKTSTILFLNKRDLFEEKLKIRPLSDLFPDFTGGSNYDLASDFVKSTFESQKLDPEKAIYTHKTCATDTDNINFVLSSCFDIILSAGLARSGLL